ncbi:MAG TPA: nuclear transport factor 2 family protein [Pyrinomonadaceae bacterium]|nr:nuclear transport factor 2 family protein [Pyrinomonadaceae bacterium]
MKSRVKDGRIIANALAEKVSLIPESALALEIRGFRMKKFVFSIAVVLAIASFAFAQNTNSSTTKVRPRTTNTNATPSPTPKQASSPKPAATATPAKKTTAAAPGSEGVLAAFNKILDGIRHANVDDVTTPYWNSKQLILFNNNGTVTRGWEQMRKNRESSYPDMKDVKLEVRDVHVTMLGRDGALVSCLWTQSLTFKGVPETATGRMTLVFKRLGTEWKAIHLHTSNDRPDPSRVPSSEQVSTPSPTNKP